MFRVDPKTVTRWAKAGKLTSIRTLGGHRRYRETEVRVVALVLELTGDLNLLGLGSAAPHWLDPLERPEPVKAP